MLARPWNQMVPSIARQRVATRAHAVDRRSDPPGSGEGDLGRPGEAAPGVSPPVAASGSHGPAGSALGRCAGRDGIHRRGVYRSGHRYRYWIGRASGGRVGSGSWGISGSGDQPGRALHGRRAHRHRDPPGRRADGSDPRPADRHPERCRRGRDAGGGPGRCRGAGWLHHPDAPHRHVHRADAVQRPAVRPAGRLRDDRSGHRGADDDL